MASVAPFTVSGKTAIITGAGSGINLAFAELLLSQNCNVVIADLILRQEAKDVISRYQDEAEGPRALFIETDVASWPALTRMFEFALTEFGDFDIVCPGAGVYEPLWSNFWLPPGSEASKDGTDQGHYALMDINLTHPIRVTQLAISYWMYPREKAGSGFPCPAKVSVGNPKRIVHISSIGGQSPVFRSPLYCASKFAITGFIRSLAPLEGEHGVRVNGVAPGLVITPLWTAHPEKLSQVDLSKDTWITPREVAEAMLSCVADDNNKGGTILEVGAGYTRQVAALNDPGPDTRPDKGCITVNSSNGDEEVLGWLLDESIWGARPS